MYVYSGTYRQCTCGQETPLKDDAGNILRTGDIVMSYTVNNFGVANFDGLTVVVSDEWQSYSDGTHIKKEGAPEAFVMGIKDCDLELETGNYPEFVWRVRRVKRFEDVIAGEQWKDFGFNYSGT